MSNKLDFLTTGSIPMNLACSQKGLDGGIPRGRITNIVGDGSSGKTLKTLEICANANANPKSKVFPKTKKITIHYNNPEEVMDFDLNLMYGDEFVEDVVWKHIETVEATGYDIAKTLKSMKKDEGVVYVVDSWDALKSEKGFEEFNKIVDGKAVKKGSYNLEKQKYGTQEFFPNICKLMSGVDFTLIIISQTRDKIGSTFPEKTRSGGQALNFYTHLVVWLSDSGKLKKTVEDQDFVRGIISKCKVKRSKVSKAFREAETTITFDYGVDNIKSCFNYLIGSPNRGKYSTEKVIDKIGIDKKLIPKKKNKEGKTEMASDITESKLMSLIEENDLEDFLSNKTEEVWMRREEKLYEDRKPKFSKTKKKILKKDKNEDSEPKHKEDK